jgi:hypothetical protein
MARGRMARGHTWPHGSWPRSFLLVHAKALPTGGYRDVAHFAAAYVLHGRNPIATAMVIARVR